MLYYIKVLLNMLFQDYFFFKVGNQNPSLTVKIFMYILINSWLREGSCVGFLSQPLLTSERLVGSKGIQEVFEYYS